MDPHVSLSRPESPATCPAGTSQPSRTARDKRTSVLVVMWVRTLFGGVPASAFSLTGRLLVGMSCWLSLLFNSRRPLFSLPLLQAGLGHRASAWTIAGASLGCPSSQHHSQAAPSTSLRAEAAVSHQWSCCLLPQSCLSSSLLSGDTAPATLQTHPCPPALGLLSLHPPGLARLLFPVRPSLIPSFKVTHTHTHPSLLHTSCCLL